MRVWTARRHLAAARPLEIDATSGAVVELARLTGVATPRLDTLDGLVRLLARSTGTTP